MTNKYCSYLDCNHKVNFSQPLDFCDGCGRALVLCPNIRCSWPNHVSAIYCRACGEKLPARMGLIKKYTPMFLNEGLQSRGQFYRKELFLGGPGVWNLKLKGINDSLLLFAGGASDKYDKLYLLHPFLQSDLIDLTDLMGTKEGLSGFLALTNRYLFVGSGKYLYQITIPSISSLIPHSIEFERHDIPAGKVYYFSEDSLLIDSGSNISLWNISERRVESSCNVSGKYITLNNKSIVIAGDKLISFVHVDRKDDALSFKKEINLDRREIISDLCYVKDKLYVIAAEGQERMLLKWDLDEKGLPIDDKERIVARGNIVNILRIQDRYLLIFSNAINACDTFSDRVDYQLNLQVNREVVPSASGFLTAFPLVNPDNNNDYIAVINIKNGQYVYTMPNSFMKIYNEPYLWGRYLFCVVQKTLGGLHTIYGFDLRGALL